ncbi:uncharacterized protein LOC112559428 isoform X2 [Pomacea canaliculata]|nr:uncharacterized protein LOC112559428 isoform X2 [Pomacea canaliculata]
MSPEAVVQVLLLVTGLAAAQEPQWGFQSYLDEDFTVVCNDSSLILEPYNFVVWETPVGDLIEINTLDKYVVSNVGKVINMHLTIKNVQEADKGVYLCHVYTDAQKIQKRGRMLRGLNIGGPMYREPFDEYRDHLMVGGICALILLVPLMTLCLLYKFRYQSKEVLAAKREARLMAMARHHQLQNGLSDQGTEFSTMSEGGEINHVYTNYDEKSTHL